MITVGCMYQPSEAHYLDRLIRQVGIEHLFLLPVAERSNQAMNRRDLILKAPDTKYFTWVDPDDFIELDYLQDAVDMMEHDDALAMVKGREITHHLDGSTEWSDLAPPALDELSSNPLAYHNGVVFRTDRLRAVAKILPAELFYSLDHSYRTVLAHQYTYANTDAVGYHWMMGANQHHRVPMSSLGGLVAPFYATEWIAENIPNLLRRKPLKPWNC